MLDWRHIWIKAKLIGTATTVGMAKMHMSNERKLTSQAETAATLASVSASSILARLMVSVP